MGVPCETCGAGKENMIRIFQSPTVSYEMGHPAKRAGSGWNDVLKRVEKYAGTKRSTVEHY